MSTAKRNKRSFNPSRIEMQSSQNVSLMEQLSQHQNSSKQLPGSGGLSWDGNGAATDDVNKVGPSSGTIRPSSRSANSDKKFFGWRGHKRSIEDPQARHRRLKIERGDVATAVAELLVNVEEEYGRSGPNGNQVYSDITAATMPLYLFDDLTFETHRPEQWIEMNTPEDNDQEIAIPAAGLRSHDPTALGVEDGRETMGQWVKCVVTGYDAIRELYAVTWGDRRGEDADTLLPRLYVCFAESDRYRFAARFRLALWRRQQCESLIRYNLYIDCMPIDDGITELEFDQVNRILSSALSGPGGTTGSSQNAFASALLEEVTAEYMRTMNKLVFDANLRSTRGRSEQMALLALPEEPLLPPPPESGVVVTPPHDFPTKFGNFSFKTFLTNVQAVEAMRQVREECNNMLPVRITDSKCARSHRLDEFTAVQRAAADNASRLVKELWPASVSHSIDAQLKSSNRTQFNLEESNMANYEASQLRHVLRRVNLMMQDTLRFLIRDSMEAYTAFIERAAAGTAVVMSTSSVKMEYEVEGGEEMDDVAYQAAHRVIVALRPPPLFAVGLQVSADRSVINQAEVDARKREIELYEMSQEGLEEDERVACPLEPVAPRLGHTFEFETDVTEFSRAVLDVFDQAVVLLAGMEQVERLILSRLFWQEVQTVASVDPSEEWVVALRGRVEAAVARAVAPLENYRRAFDRYIPLLNLDLTEYLAGLDHVKTVQDEDGNDVEVVDLSRLEALVEKHRQEQAAVVAAVPTTPCKIGMFSVSSDALRSLLGQKHAEATRRLLDRHLEHCNAAALSLERRFEEINKRLGQVPLDIEQLVELQQFMDAVPEALEPLQLDIETMVSNFGLLDGCRFHATEEESGRKWTVFGWPAKVGTRMAQAELLVADRKVKYAQAMEDEQEQFAESLIALQSEVEGFSAYTDVSKVEPVANHVKQVVKKLSQAEEDVKLYNSREVLFGHEVTDYESLGLIKKAFEPYNNLWATADKWLRSHKLWTNGAFFQLDAEQVETEVDQCSGAIVKALKFFEKAGMSQCAEIATAIKSQVTAFKPHVPLIVSLRNKGMRDRHWEELSAALGFDLQPDDRLTLTDVLELDLGAHIELVSKVGESAGKEYQIEKALNSMSAAWESVELNITAYRETGTSVIKGVDELQAVLDEHITMTQAMQFSAFKKPFESRIDAWEAELRTVSDVLEEWVAVQRNWLYLQPIFESPDINKQLPTEGKRFLTVDKNWRQTLSSAKAKPSVLGFCSNEKLLERFRESNRALDMVQKGLSDYLETKRAVFARFYFLSNDELLSILSESKDVKLVQPHLKKCFEGIYEVEFQSNLTITHMISAEGEKVPFSTPVDPVGKNVEAWMVEVEAMMRTSVRDVMHKSIQHYLTVPRTKWVQKWPGMCVLNGSQLHWTREMEEALAEKGAEGCDDMLGLQLGQLDDMVMMVRGPLDKMTRITLGALTVIDVHARDVTKKLVAERTADKHDFNWISQLRYYWEDDMWAEMVSARRPYGYEYLGNSFRLVITPLTDKCYMTIMGALQMTLGGAPAGPAGTGKTETTKDLAKALAKQCVVFNCSDGLDYLAMGKFFKGLASCGAWACFDEFNRIDIEVLSVVGQQISTLQLAIRAGEERIDFEDSNIPVNPQFGVFITMNPGYAGRTELPDSLKALFRPVAMMVPDYALIGEIMFFAYGFGDAKNLGQKMVTTFKLCSEQLSAQSHYDYGMRAVKTVITAAGNLKRSDPDEDEQVLLLRALQDVNLPKFLAHDLPLFSGIISDLFPGKQRPEIDLGSLIAVIKLSVQKLGLQPHPFFLTKVVQLYETICVRHGLMVVGPTGGGKSSNLNTLRAALTELKNRGEKGFAYERTREYRLNPKSITMGQLYGEFDANTHEWQDGVLSTLYRGAASDTSSDRKWVVFDGPVDAIWIENMNTVLDDNKKLCLNSGEMLQMSNTMSMIFEVEDLSVASPATVSRTGMVYMEPSALGANPLLQSWMERLPSGMTPPTRASLMRLFDTYVTGSLAFLRSFLVELVPTVDNNLVCSLLRLLDCYLVPYYPKEGKDPPTKEMFATLEEMMEPIFLFCAVWSLGVTVTDAGRLRFDAFLRSEMSAGAVIHPIPSTGLVYDYLYDTNTQEWVRWMSTVPVYAVDRKLSFAEVVVPTMDSVRNTFLLELLLMQNKHVLMVGGTGTGKTVNIGQFLMGASTPKIAGRCVPISLTFSAQTSANQTQDLLDGKMEKRKKGVFGPPVGKTFVVYVDDLNMPKREEYFAQPPIELLRQWFDQGGWYDRKALAFRAVVDLVMVCSMGPPGGGRNPISGRFVRQFNVIGYAEMSDESKSLVFTTIFAGFLAPFVPEVQQLCGAMVGATIEVYNTISTGLLPTPSKSHYTFNLRDLAKVFQGLLMCDNRRVSSPAALVRLWVHEGRRVFADRLVDERDHVWFHTLLKSQVRKHFSMEWEEVVPEKFLIFGDYMDPGADPRVYEEVSDVKQLVSTVEEYLAEHNAESKQPMPLVMFLDAIEHVSRVSRVIRQPQGNALLLGVGGSGRQSMTKLASFMAGYSLFQVEISKGYGVPEWRDDLRRCLLLAGLKDKPTVFLFSDVQIVNETMLEDVNNILNAGDVPNLYGAEDLDKIMNTCRVDCQKKHLPPTKLNIFSQYIIRVRRNLHVCLAMSPIGSAFRDRLRMFPSLVNCCTIDWFHEWPAEALYSVAMAAMTGEDLKLGERVEAVVEMFKLVHQGVERKSKEFFDMLRRHNHVTPTSYLELLSTFKKLLGEKRVEVDTKRHRLQVGLDKLMSTKEQVSGMKEELVELQPQLVVTQKEVTLMMVQITKDKEEADVTKAAVEVEEAAANEKAQATQAIADDAQRDLDEALPALDAAVACLNKLKKSDIDEVKSMKTPPSGVKLTMEVACIMFNIKPIKKNVPDQPGKKYDDYWESAQKSLLGKAQVFMDMLVHYDKDNIGDRVIAKLQPYVSDPEFTPAAIEKASKACTAICMWALAMNKYHHVAKAVEPKKEALRGAQAELDQVVAQLQDAKGRLKAVVDRLAELESNYSGAVTKKEQLAQKVVQCEVQLSNAGKLIGGLGGEETRWKESVASLNEEYENLIGDVMVSAGTISYLGAFTAEFRSALVLNWQAQLSRLLVPHTPACDIQVTLADPVLVRSWQLLGLPTDSLSTQNGLIMNKARRWPLLIDPQGQANRFIKAQGRDEALCANGMDVVKLSDKNFLRALENAVRFGKWVLLENILEELDASLEPILLQQKFKQGGEDVIRVGDSTIPYNDAFRFFMTTKLPNPHYPPEVCVKVTLLNFTITQVGLEEQLLGVVVSEEMPELAEKKNSLLVSNSAMNKQLYEIESQILYNLSNAEGNILDDTQLIETLAQAKVTSEEIKVKMGEAEALEHELHASSESYRPVAFRASQLYFCIADLAIIDPMYQYALPWFTQLFIKGVGDADPSSELPTRLTNLNDYFTGSVYRNVCRSLFERHKLLFSFLLCVQILRGDGAVDPLTWRFLISGMAPEPLAMENPDPSWIEARCWTELCGLASLPAFTGLADSVSSKREQWRTVFDSAEPQTAKLPIPYQQKLSPLERMCVLRCFRPDKITEAIQLFVAAEMGQSFIEPPPFDLPSTYKDSVSTTPLIFILSTGSDPNKDLLQFADSVGMIEKLKSIALGQGQGKLASRLIEQGVSRGEWVLLQNCHLSISWMPELERICEELDPNVIDPDFRLWLTSMPSAAFPVAVLQNGVKMTKEPPKGLRANLKTTYYKLSDEALNVTAKPDAYKKLLFGLCFFHANVIERKRFGPLGWNIPYEFNDTDLDISAAQLQMFLDQYDEIPYQVLSVMTSVINYGGRITDDKDMRTSDIILSTFFCADILTDTHTFSRSGTYYSIPFDQDYPHKSYMDYIDSLPINPDPEVFGMHDNANITCAQAETYETFGLIVSLQPRVSVGGGKSREELMGGVAAGIEADLPPPFDIEHVAMMFPVLYEESMNTVLMQEIQRFNALIVVMRRTLKELQKALRGLVVMSAELEATGDSLFDQLVPAAWQACAYPSLKPLGAWVEELLQRINFLDTWVKQGIPATFWISGFFFPQGFLTGIIQNHARKHRLPIDTVSFSFVMMDAEERQLMTKPVNGCYISGLYIEGARWDKLKHSLVDPLPKELFSKMPVIHLLPKQNRAPPTEGIYRAPVYKILTRTGTLSTTGHSTNFVCWIEVPSSKPTVFRNSLVSETNQAVKFCDQEYWIKAGVACFCSLRF